MSTAADLSARFSRFPRSRVERGVWFLLGYLGSNDKATLAYYHWLAEEVAVAPASGEEGSLPASSRVPPAGRPAMLSEDVGA